MSKRRKRRRKHACCSMAIAARPAHIISTSAARRPRGRRKASRIMAISGATPRISASASAPRAPAIAPASSRRASLSTSSCGAARWPRDHRERLFWPYGAAGSFVKRSWYDFSYILKAHQATHRQLIKSKSISILHRAHWHPYRVACAALRFARGPKLAGTRLAALNGEMKSRPNGKTPRLFRGSYHEWRSLAHVSSDQRNGEGDHLSPNHLIIILAAY